MGKRVMLVTGTPGVGKTTLAKKLAEKLNAEYVNLTELSEKANLAKAKDKIRGTNIIDEAKMHREIKTMIEKSQTDLVIDGHYAAAVTPKAYVTHIFVLRRNPVELRRVMRQLGFNAAKQEENLAAEILDVCLVEALHNQEKEKICELDVTGKTTEETLGEVLEVIDHKKQCFVGVVDWLGLLEREGKLDEYLKT